ncbi:MAG: dihydrodipicolinate synthase family protein [Proteobacteria bacterium]|nr:dihydrodipicolinate synthase family protein [Pseudomonadota bacterium]
MRTLEGYSPRRGLSIPCVTALDPDGRPHDEDQRRLVRFLVGGGRGADVIFVMGTTGEWNRLPADARHRAIRVCVEEVRKQNAALELDPGEAVEAWVGVTARSTAETLETLELALEVGADAAVLAPLAVGDAADPVRLVARDVADFLDARSRRLPVFLYDNAEIAAGEVGHLRTRWVKALSRLDFVRGIKVTAAPRRLGHYAKAARQFRDLGAFGFYVGNPPYVLEWMRPRQGAWGKLVEHWNRFLLHDLLPTGVVAGPANLWPREWQRAWQVAQAGDIERTDQLAALFERFGASYRFAQGKRSLAALKRGLRLRGVLSCDAVAPGTPELDAAQGRRFDAEFEALLGQVRHSLPPRWVSRNQDANER